MLVLLEKAMINMDKEGTVKFLQKRDLLHNVLLLLIRHLLPHENLFHGHLLRQSACFLEVSVDYFNKYHLTETSRAYLFDDGQVGQF